MARPTTTRWRSAALAALATERRRPTLEANVVTATRCFAEAMICANPSAMSDSDGDVPSLRTFVESQIMARQPSSPSALSRSTAIGLPITGRSSIFQSPVCRTLPPGVRIARAFGSGMECATSIYSMLNGPRSNRAPSSISLIRFVLSSPRSANLARNRLAVNGVAKTGASKRSHRSITAPKWSSWPWVSRMPCRLHARLRYR